jgi:dihydrofolate synthase/folylpolyglutamate synthase
MENIMNYSEARQYIEKAGQYGMVLGLTTMQSLLSRLGNPQKELSFIHIAGTNGKGSVGAFLSEILAASGIKTGRYVSPALFSYEERIQINDKTGTSLISKEQVAKWLTVIQSVTEEMVEEGKAHPTPFEIETAMAFLEFQEQDCELVVLETGLGGRLDATNVIDTGVCQVFTAISRDHMQFLGEKLSQIAEEKAGIIKPGVPVVSWQQEPEAAAVLENKAKALDCPMYQVDFSKLSVEEMTLTETRFTYRGEHFSTGLLGENQPKNAAVAIEAAKVLSKKGYPVTREAVKAGIKNAKWLGRFSVISQNPLIVIDGAHNEAAAKSLATSLKVYFPDKRLIAVVGMFRDKEYDKVLYETLPLMSEAYTIKPFGERGLEAELLADCGKNYCKKVTACKSVGEAFEKAKKAAQVAIKAEKGAAVIVYGSLSFLHEILDLQE